MNAKSFQQPENTGRSFADARPPFDGRTYQAEFDFERMNSQLGKVYLVLSDGAPHRIDHIAESVGSPSTAGVTARIRDLRKEKHGGYEIRSWRDSCEPKSGLWWYQMVVREKEPRAIPRKELEEP